MIAQKIEPPKQPMNCGYCRDCESWSRTGGLVDAESPQWGECERADADTFSPVPKPLDPAALAFAPGQATDWGDIGGILLTRPDFGCVQFHARVAEDG